MSMQDPISDLLTRIRNAQQIRSNRVLISSSKLKTAIVNVLKEEGYIKDYNIKENKKTNVRNLLKILSWGTCYKENITNKQTQF
jgi:small subunit ribosomal protein S8